MKNAQARTTYLRDYRPPDFTIETTDLHFDLHEDHALVNARLKFKRNDNVGESVEKGVENSVVENVSDTLVLHGQHLVLESLIIESQTLADTDYLVDDETLTIPNLSRFTEGEASEFLLECRTRIEPQNNTALEGLYKSKKMFCTQCEAEGFRRITYYLDRPDVMSKFTTKITADKQKYPVLLSNGNKIDSGECPADSSRHWSQWEDPFKKPSYLFALVAGDLVSLDDSFTTCSGRDIALQIFVEAKDLDKCDHAMLSLKNSMRWDEEVYGREYDLDIFMIVAVDDFNMGAMENKGLNVFNTSCVLANQKTQSDMAFQRVEAVVAHEYFHNWSGNRVTCRDWFQLSLKEGFTVFRDSEFSADMNSRTVKRIDDVAFLRTVQFAEDGGPMAHSVRPDSYMEISNFYTVTIYEKGAEVVRMIRNLLGAEKFRAGSDLYFDRHDGQAVTTEDFVVAMEDASGVDLTRFRHWYSQAGTPVVTVAASYDASTKQYSLRIRQDCPDTPGQTQKQPFHIPFKLGLLGAEGEELPLQLDPGSDDGPVELVLDVLEQEQEFVFHNIEQAPVPSLLRGFSAPVRLHFDYSREELYFLMLHDRDGFNRWNASQSLAIDVISEGLLEIGQSEQFQLPEIMIQAYAGVLDATLSDDSLDKAMVGQLLNLPGEGFLIEQSEVADVDGIHKVRESLANALAKELKERFARLYELNLSDAEYSADAESIARRSIKNLALSYLVRTADEEWLNKCSEQFNSASNMTDQLSALRHLVNSDAALGAELASKALDSFYDQWSHEPLVVDQWFAVQATSQRSDTLSRVNALLEHADFSMKNPNKVRSVISAFCGQNHIGFHDQSGSGYEFLADQVLALDKINPQIAARLITPLTRWKKFDLDRQAKMQAQLQRIKLSADLSKDVFEVVEKSTV